MVIEQEMLLGADFEGGQQVQLIIQNYKHDIHKYVCDIFMFGSFHNYKYGNHIHNILSL